MDAPVHLIDLPDSLLVEAASYLTFTTRALFAVAITASPSSWLKFNWQIQPSSASRAIMGHNEIAGDSGGRFRRRVVQDGRVLLSEMWVELDFEDVPKSLRVRLSDADVGGVLVLMDAQHTLQSLKLTHCFGVTGVGLEPLRGSKALARIDLSLVGLHESPAIDDGDFALDEGTVICLLDSIIGLSGSSLMHIQLPKRWGEDQREEIKSFFARYGEYLDNRQLTCQCRVSNQRDRYGNRVDPCEDTVQATDERPWMRTGAPCGVQDCACYSCLGTGIGCVQDNVCYMCLKVCCRGCADWSGCVSICSAGCQKALCEYCETVSICNKCDDPLKSSCFGCELMKECSGCGAEYCSDCQSARTCDTCPEEMCICTSGRTSCEDDLIPCDGEGCDKLACLRCSEDNARAPSRCSGCQTTYCYDCRLQICRRERRERGRDGCPDCVRTIAPTLLQEYDSSCKMVPARAASLLVTLGSVIITREGGVP